MIQFDIRLSVGRLSLSMFETFLLIRFRQFILLIKDSKTRNPHRNKLKLLSEIWQASEMFNFQRKRE